MPVKGARFGKERLGNRRVMSASGVKEITGGGQNHDTVCCWNLCRYRMDVNHGGTDGRRKE